jgi:hypothetical protein
MKPATAVFILALWTSGWLPMRPEAWAWALGVAIAGATIAAALRRGAPAGRRGARRLLFGLALLFLAGGLCLAFFARALGTPAEGAIMLFHTAGVVACALLLSAIGAPKRARLAGASGAALLLLAAWSWGSALAMFMQRGGPTQAAPACILAPTRLSYDQPLRSVWDMRLPGVLSTATGPTGTTILSYHAVLIVPGPVPAQYNWSKLRLRFEPLDRARNPYLPADCPPAQ